MIDQLNNIQKILIVLSLVLMAYAYYLYETNPLIIKQGMFYIPDTFRSSKSLYYTSYIPARNQIYLFCALSFISFISIFLFRDKKQENNGNMKTIYGIIITSFLFPVSLVVDPYLQNATPNSMTIMWETDVFLLQVLRIMKDL